MNQVPVELVEIVHAKAGSSSTAINRADDSRLDDTPQSQTRPWDAQSSVTGAEDPQSGIAELPPGYQAWRFCFSALALEILIWGWNYSYGVFQDYYLKHEPFNQAPVTLISAIGTSSTAIQYMESILIIALCQRYPRLVKPAMWIALATCVLAMLISSFATQVWQLVLLQGIVFGLAGGVLYVPIIMWLSEWFVERRGLAGGIIFGGSGIGGFVFPLLIGACLNNVGYAWTIRIFAAVLGVGCSICLIGINARVPVRGVVAAPRPQKSYVSALRDLAKNPLILWMGAANAVQALGYFPVSVFLLNYTSTVTSSPVSPTVALACFNAASVVCYVIFGRICDSYPYPAVMLFSGIGSALGAFLLWGFATNVGLVFAFAIVFGGLSGGFSGVWPATATQIAGSNHEYISYAFGTFGLVKGLGAIVGPIIAAGLRDESKAASSSLYGAFGFRSMEMFVGSMASATAAFSVGVAIVSKSQRKKGN
ncbi:major facilitator superfamily domain-containing protein [Pterulicium gracile]|uniref:Major facilitator superfamily domain-containing protein n=1 Tax=Pterulicium gracile TaxID=1884261 RepID=A0A5C3Q918_9AGAR|nr:major facilitator superfamily domain-containing protein [Pterula gracilis]